MDLSSHRKTWIDFENRGLNEERSHRFSINSTDLDLHHYDTVDAESTHQTAPNSAVTNTTQKSHSTMDLQHIPKSLKMWLASYNLGKYHSTLVNNDITLDLLVFLRKEDIKELIPLVGDRIRLIKAITELSLNPAISDEPTSSVIGSRQTPPSTSTEFDAPTQVRFYTVDNKAIHLDIRPNSPIQSKVYHTAKLPSGGAYRIHDGFDFYDDDTSLRDAIFKRNIRELWIQADSGSKLMSTNSKKDSKTNLTDSELGTLMGDEGISEFTSMDRPTSLEVANHISDFFPGSKQELLAEGLRNSMLINNRFSTISGGWRSSVRISRRLSNLSICDPPSTDDTELQSIVDKLTAHEQPELNSKFLEKLDNEEMSPSEWLRGKLIGSGSFGSVYLAFNVFNGDIMAVKQVQLLQTDQRQKKMVDAMHHEIRTLRSLEHKNIVQYRGFKKEGEYLNIFLEYIPGGSLATKLSKNGPLKEETVRRYIKQCLSGLEYLHDRGIIHRDIKGANILVDTDDNVKISDFGLSKHEDTAKQRYSMQGTAFWMAPEVARAREQTTTKADIWSLGCLIVELITGQHPFPKLQAFQAIYKIGKGFIPDFPDNISKLLREVLVQCLKVDPEERPSAHELLQHPFFDED